jgi:D-psicose/D-tagatose/L-ribulose 3-epimerase
MRIGINTFLFACPFHNQHTRWFPKFRRWGYESVEIALAEPGDINPDYVREALESHGLVAGSVCGIFGPGRDLRGSSKEQAATVNYVKGLIPVMKTLGSSILVGPMYSAVGRAGAETAAAKRQQWKLVQRHLRDLAGYAGDHGVTLGLEPLNRFESDFMNTCDQALEMIADVGHPALKVHLDTFHMNIEEKDLAQAVRRAGPHLGHLHASGSDRGTPGNDHTDWKGIAAALRAVKYQGDVVVESFTSDLEMMARATSIWRRIEPSRDEIAGKGARFLKRLLK